MQKPTVMVPVQREKVKEDGTKGRRGREGKGGEIEGCWDSELASNGV